MIEYTIDQRPSSQPSTAALLLGDLVGLGSSSPLRSKLREMRPDANGAGTDPDIADSAQGVVAFLLATRRERRRSAMLTILSLPLTALLRPKCVRANIRSYREWSLISRDLDALTVAKYNFLVKMELACRSVAAHPAHDDTSQPLSPPHFDAP